MSSANFMEWVIRHGGQNFGIDIRDCPNEGGKGLFATADFRENEVLVSIPDALVITAGSVADMEDMCEVFQSFRLKPFEALVYFFIAERQQNSKWFPYMQVLPTSFSTPAYLYPFLKSEDFPFKSRKQWYEQQQEISRMYRRFVAILGETTNWDKFLWAWHIVNTRCMYRNNKPHPLIDSSKGDTLAIVPLIDMLNHSNDSQCYTFWDNKLNVYKVIANRSVHKGDQVFVCYGSHSNELLWIEYGFRLERNICNKVEIPLEDFIRLANVAGIKFSEAHRKALLRANLPCTVYASDSKANFGLKANLTLLRMSSSKLDKWAEEIYKEVEKATDDDIITVLQLLCEQLIESRDKSPEQLQWLWNEEIELVTTLLGDIQLETNDDGNNISASL